MPERMSFTLTSKSAIMSCCAVARTVRKNWNQHRVDLWEWFVRYTLNVWDWGPVAKQKRNCARANFDLLPRYGYTSTECKRTGLPLTRRGAQSSALLTEWTTFSSHCRKRTFTSTIETYCSHLRPNSPRYVLSNLHRWALDLSRFDFHVKHVDREWNICTDILKRWAKEYRTFELRLRTVAVFYVDLVPSTMETSQLEWDDIKQAQSLHSTPKKS